MCSRVRVAKHSPEAPGTATYRFRHASSAIHELGSDLHHRVSRAQHGQIGLRLFAAVVDGVEQLLVNTSQSCQSPGVHLVILTVTVVDDAELACIGDDDVVTVLLQ